MNNQMSKMLDSLSERQKQEFLEEHFSYELEMFFFALRENIKISSSGKRTDESTLRNNMALENFLMHGRIFLEFFYHKSSKNKFQAFAWHFFENNKDWDNLKPKKTEDIKLLENRVNSEVTHLGYDRIKGTPKEKGWDSVKLLHDFMNIAKIFMIHLPKKYKTPRIKKTMQGIQ